MQKNKKSACNVHKKSVLYESTVKRTLYGGVGEEFLEVAEVFGDGGGGFFFTY